MSRLQSIKVGAHVWAHWLGEGGKPVTRNLADARAQVCLGCPYNRRGSWWDGITKQAAVLLMDTRRLRLGLNLHAKGDEDLYHCDICHCPLAEKIWVPMAYIEPHTEDGTWKTLPPHCWMRLETRR